MANCVKNSRTNSYLNLIIGFQVTVENVGNALFGTQCTKLLNGALRRKRCNTILAYININKLRFRLLLLLSSFTFFFAWSKMV